MSSADGHNGNESVPSPSGGDHGSANLETMLFESLVHQLIEKGMLTRNDALSIVQTVAEVKRGQVPEAGNVPPHLSAELVLLRRLYESFEALTEDSARAQARGDNVRVLRPPVHRDAPEFPPED